MSEHPGFAAKIERLRMRRTQRGVALQIGIAPAVLSDFELGYRDLPPEIVARLRDALGFADSVDAPRADAVGSGSHSGRVNR